MNRKLLTISYIAFDGIMSILVWIVFFSFRKEFIDIADKGFMLPVGQDSNLYKGILLVPFYWIGIYFLAGLYGNVYKRSRLRELLKTFNASLLGVLLLFFLLLLDDQVKSYKAYYYSILTLFGFQFLFTYIPKFILSTRTKNRIRRKEIGFRTILVGNQLRALELFREIEFGRDPEGYKFIGYVSVNNEEDQMRDKLSLLGSWEELARLVEEHKAEEVVIALDQSDHDLMRKIITQLEGVNITVKVMPDMYDILTGMVKVNHIFGAPLIEVNTEIMPQWQQFTKRAADVLVSLVVLMLASPVYLLIALLVKTSSKGPVFYKQERIGLHGKPFYIFKFRSMYTDAEKMGPQLSKDKDSRITPIGRFLRKVRLDELPQFYNVLIGDMSLVGPRPERQFFIDQIVQKAPHYKHLHKVRPGITSWGQVKYGYAENVDQMVERLKFDILYIENMSLTVDLRILVYTILIIIQGRGK